MALTVVILILILGFHLGEKGKAYRAERHDERIKKEAGVVTEKKLGEMRETVVITPEDAEEMKRKAKEEEYRADLKRQGYTDELITTILPTIMNDGQ